MKRERQTERREKGFDEKKKIMTFEMMIHSNVGQFRKRVHFILFLPFLLLSFFRWESDSHSFRFTWIEMEMSLRKKEEIRKEKRNIRNRERKLGERERNWRKEQKSSE